MNINNLCSILKHPVRFVVQIKRIRRMERAHGFPCRFCGAKTFEEAGDLCCAAYDCPGDSMSKEMFESFNRRGLKGGG